MRIALIQPPVWGVYGPPVGLAQLAACLKQAGHEVLVRDLNIHLYRSRSGAYRNVWAIEQSGFWNDPSSVRAFFQENRAAVESYMDGILAAAPGMVCLSVNVSSRFAARELAGMVKRAHPGTLVVAGGPLFLVPFDPGEFLDGSGIFDVIVRGEGERTLVALADVVSRGGDLAEIAGIFFKKNGIMTETSGMPPLRNLDELPFLDFSELPFERYDPPGHLGNHISLMTSRGCVQSCVFCGPRAYWPGYRTMSGKRIYDEICFHAANQPGLTHIEFLDLLLNGNMRTLVDLCDLLSARPPKKDLHWHANLIVRKEMTGEVFRKMKGAGCTHVTFGIESGSQRVLGLMRKHYRTEDADRVLAAVHGAGITVTCNFMFGFPGETDEDFGETLAFLERNRASIDIAYPSRTFCTIEPYSYLQAHLPEFDMVPNPHHGQYWSSKDGANTYPVRMRRCEEFSRRAHELGVDVGLGLQTSLELDRWLNLGSYYEATGDRRQALDCYRRYLALDPENAVIKGRAAALGRENA